MTNTRFSPGPATAYVSDDVVALADVADAAILTSCVTCGEWPSLVSALADRTDVAVVSYEADVLRIAIIGAVVVRVETIDGEQRFDGESDWATHVVDRPRDVTISTRAAPDDLDPQQLPFCVDGGMVPAEAVSRRLVAPASEATDPFEALFGHTVVRSVESAAVRSGGGDVDDLRAPLGVLVFSTGERVLIDRPMVLGRHPRRLDDADPDASIRRVKVASPGVSRRHAMIRIDRWHASIDDLGSSNGTRVALPGRVATPVRPGHPVDLVPGAVVDLGGDVSFAVEEVA